MPGHPDPGLHEANSMVGAAFSRATHGPGGFTLSPEDAAIVRQMAMNNGAENMPNIPGVTTNDDYNQKVSREMNNHICNDILQRAIKDINKTYYSRLSLVENGIVESLFTCEGDIKMDIPTLESQDMNIDEYLELLDTMGYFKLESEYKRIVMTARDLGVTMKRLKCIEDLREGADVSKDVMTANAMRDYPDDLDVETFKADSEKYLKNLELAEAKAKARLEALAADGSLLSLAYIRESMLEALYERKAEVNPEAPNYQMSIDRFDVVIGAYEDITNVDVLGGLLDTYLATSKKNIRAALADLVMCARSGGECSVFDEIDKHMQDPGLARRIVTEIGSQFVELATTEDPQYTDQQLISAAYLLVVYLNKQAQSTKVKNYSYARNTMVMLNHLYDEHCDVDGADEFVKNLFDTYYWKLKDLWAANPTVKFDDATLREFFNR